MARHRWIHDGPAALRYALLGFAGFFQFFTAEFQGDRERVALAANGLFPSP